MGRVVKALDLGVDGLNVSLHSDSNYWRARIKLKDGKWITKSLKTISEKEAIVSAIKLHTELSLGDESVLSKKGYKSFRLIAEEVISELEATNTKNKSKSNYSKFIKECTYEFFKEEPIDNIGYQKIQAYYKWRNERYGDKPKSSLNKHNIALRMVFRKAIEKEIPIKIDLNNFQNNGIKEKSRELFTVDEIDKIQSYLVEAVKKSKNDGEFEKYDILLDVIEFLLCSGVRAGEEYYNIKWGDINISIENDIPVLRIYIENGKTGARNIIVKTHFLSTLKMIAKKFPNRTKDDYIFSCKDGSRLSKDTFSRLFTKIVKHLNIRTKQSGVKTLYSLRHSFITWHLIDGIETFSLTKQCGTSVSMLERYYEKVKAEDELAKLTGIANTQNKADNTYASTRTVTEKYKTQSIKMYRELIENCRTRGFP